MRKREEREEKEKEGKGNRPRFAIIHSLTRTPLLNRQCTFVRKTQSTSPVCKTVKQRYNRPEKGKEEKEKKKGSPENIKSFQLGEVRGRERRSLRRNIFERAWPIIHAYTPS